MKGTILHITPNFEPTRCGVSDYVLAWNGILGHENNVVIAAIHDRFFKGISDEHGVLRIGKDISLMERISCLQSLMKRYLLTHIVFHYVPFGYHLSGLPIWLIKLLPLLNRTGSSITLLLHEIWVGGNGKPLSIQIKGGLQRRFLLHWIRRLPFAHIITTSAYTSAQLFSEGLAANWCPVFNNLGMGVAEKLTGVSGFIWHENTDKKRVILFGSMPPDASPYEVAFLLETLHVKTGDGIDLVHVGYGEIDAYWNALQAACTNLPVTFTKVGPLSAEEINKLMREADWGLSTYPYELWSKSGSIAAMLSNGLPVVVLGKLPDSGPSFPAELHPNLYAWRLLETKNLEQFFQSNNRVKPYDYNSIIAARLQAVSGIGNFNALLQYPKLTVVITVYKCWPQAKKCLEALFNFSDTAEVHEVILINDDPSSSLPEWLKKFDRVKVEMNSENIGYVRSVNKGVKLASNEFILLLDADAWLLEPITPALLLMLCYPQTMLVVPACYNPGGKPVRRIYPAPDFRSLLLGQRVMSKLKKNSPGRPLVAHSYAWFFRKSCFENIGGLDEHLHFLEADVEFCMRLEKQFPGSLVLCSGTRVMHEGGANPIQRNHRVLEWYRSIWYILKKHGYITSPSILKFLVKCRLYVEKCTSAILSKIKFRESDFWIQKKKGREALITEINSWK